MAVIDFHSHILPGIDDGSKDTATSHKMLEFSAEQGVDLMIATPHFYADRSRIERFLEKRGKAYEKLCEQMPDRSPQVKIGAEVAFFQGISRAEKLDLLTIEGTRLLLLEMPFMPWSESEIKEIQRLLDRGYQILLAHMERYLDLPGNKRWITEIQQLPVFVQINAGSLLNWQKRRKLLQMFRRGEAQILGSDCHGMHHRPPNLAEGRKVLEKKLGQEVLEYIDREGSRLLQI